MIPETADAARLAQRNTYNILLLLLLLGVLLFHNDYDLHIIIK